MTTTFTPTVRDAIRKPWSRTVQGLTALGALVVASGDLVVGHFGIGPLLDVLVQICLLYFVLALWLGSIVEALIVPEHLWISSGKNRAVFVLLILLLPVAGVFSYLAVARRALRRAALSMEPTVRVS